MHVSRRTFLQLTSSIAVAMSGAAFGTMSDALAIPQPHVFLAACDTNEDPVSENRVMITFQGSIQLYDIDRRKVKVIPLPIFGHAVTQNPRRPSQLVTFEKWGRRGLLIDAQNLTTLAAAEPLDGYIFFGHSAFTPDGAYLINTEESLAYTSHATDGGRIVFRDPATLKMIKPMSSYGLRPHDCRMMPDGRTLVVANGGSKAVNSSLVWIDVPTGKLQRKVEFSNAPGSNLAGVIDGGYSHFTAAPDGWMISGGLKYVRDDPASKTKTMYPIVAFVSPSGEVFEPEIPAELKSTMHGEALSLCVLGNTGMVAITILQGNLCLVFDYKANKLVHVIGTPGATGVAVIPGLRDGPENFILSSPNGLWQANFSHNKDGALSAFNTDFHGSGSHLSVLSI